MTKLPGVFSAKTLSGKPYFRASITNKRKHISLGSFETESTAHNAYKLATSLLSDPIFQKYTIDNYTNIGKTLTFDKWVMLLNLRDNGLYCRNPIYLHKNYFVYYLEPDMPLKFDVEDLFYYMNHKIMRRGSHLFVAEYGMQVNILAKYGIKNYAVTGRDYRFVNGDTTDYRYRNIHVINRYHGVTKDNINGKDLYHVKIHIVGDMIVGRYSNEIEAAIAYNKAATLLKARGVNKNFPENYIDNCDEIEYAKIYNSLRISKKIRDFIPKL